MLHVPRDPFAGGLLAGVAIVCAAAYALRRAPARGLDPAVVYRAFVAAAIGGLIGGHALYVATHGGTWLRVWEEQSVFGVLLGGGTTAALYLRARRRDLLTHADLAAPAVALGYGIARIGCFLHGDDFGALTRLPVGVHYLPGTEAWQAHVARGWIDAGAAVSLAVVPVQLLLAAAGFAIALIVSRVRLPRGAAVAAAALLYGVARFLLEPLRDDFRAVAGGLSLPQLLALLFVGGGASLLLWALTPRTRAALAGARA